jgi:AcrR family transcriptional regulator
LRAARRLFAEHGYPGTSLQQIAEEAGVAVQTIYSSIGSKAALILALNDLVDEEAGVAQLAPGVRSETDPPQMIAKAVHLTRQLNERCGDLLQVMLSAAPAEPDVAAAFADGMRRHESGIAALTQRLETQGALRAGTTPEQATAAFAMMTSPPSWQQLTRRAGWTFDQSEAWLTASLTQLLLEPAPNRS